VIPVLALFLKHGPLRSGQSQETPASREAAVAAAAEAELVAAD
jgi:hypothetical protein